ncbi:Gfo/Idh/MocA family protein [Rhizobium sp. 18055]|uniref:Gfo/Idh/MocA family protein n=1 Tax=Rhizobium sp. 18055 TaxID=2681403 RepID=UPI00135B3E7C|nr:Gfo/Idh/MocA family oxidoreductase [Rhizobium sp. 18055]
MARGSKDSRRLRLGMVGGGRGAFIGSIHASAARMDDRFEIVAGCLSSDPAKAKASAGDWHIANERAYTSYEEMGLIEAGREDGIDAVAIVTPNHTHYAISKIFLKHGISVICDKPLATSLRDSLDLVDIVTVGRPKFILTHAYSGYPMVRQARELVRGGELGKIHTIHVEFIQDWLASPLDALGDKQALWRTDPVIAGPGGCIADIGTHALHLARFVSHLEVTDVCARLRSIVPGRRLDDYGHALLKFSSGAEGTLTVSQVSQGSGCGLSIRVSGDKGTLSWHQERPNELIFGRGNGEVSVLHRRTDDGTWAANSSRLPRGISEGFVEAFANIYSDAADLILGGGFAIGDLPDVIDGAIGIEFVEAAVKSSSSGGTWIRLSNLRPRGPGTVAADQSTFIVS